MSYSNEDYSRVGGRATQAEYVWSETEGKFVRSANSSIVVSTDAEVTLNAENLSDNISSVVKATKSYVDAELRLLEGDISVIVSDKTLKVRAGNTIQIEGVGYYLSGLYFVDEVNISLGDSSGLDLSFRVTRNGFGSDDLKVPDSSRASSVPMNLPLFKVGDRVTFCSDSATYAKQYDGVKVPKWIRDRTLTVSYLSGDNLYVRLKEINLWTYRSFLKVV